MYDDEWYIPVTPHPTPTCMTCIPQASPQDPSAYLVGRGSKLFFPKKISFSRPGPTPPPTMASSWPLPMFLRRELNFNRHAHQPTTHLTYTHQREGEEPSVADMLLVSESGSLGTRQVCHRWPAVHPPPCPYTPAKKASRSSDRLLLARPVVCLSLDARVALTLRNRTPQRES